MRNLSSALNWIFIAIFVAASGMLYNLLFGEPGRLYIGAIFALFCGIPILAFERGMFFPSLFHRIHRLPTPIFIASALVIDFGLISIGFAAAGSLLKSLGVLTGTWAQVTILPMDVFLYALAMSAVVVFVVRVRELLGRDVFFSLLTSRYRNPVPEERVFLFIDLVGSTAFAEKYGDLRAQQYLGSLFGAYAEHVWQHRGAIDDYIGDAAIITWPLERGIKNGRCIRCVFDILADIEKNSEFWLQTYGQVPRVRAALHGGFIITAEIGVDHHKITYFGDTVNTTARLETLCKTLERPVLISADLANRLMLPDDIVAEDLGEHAVRGRGQALGVVALARAEPKASRLSESNLRRLDAGHRHGSFT
ncbi:adenylate/guanylate cyclase domain-containing protein [Rhizobium tubonense]|uniref:Adenylate cyclase n=1 Tax=Rhizobium tubonense TaxID=484088 RepID=A0A2W4CYV7_9HYPH|nr:adenylate/guanylate cyclase domain-containing protein [Rhizobium tubonense]PZM17289.1 adenylate cyclase [Rhizobium tubonense]